MAKANITGTGYYLPQNAVTNDELSKRVDTSDEWIRQRVGIESRHIALAHETNTMMSSEAAKMALNNAGCDANDIDLLIVATSTPDDVMPSQAVCVQQALGITDAIAFDTVAACSGFIYGLGIAEQFFATGAVKKALVIGAERMSRVVNWEDRATCVLFGDGAGAVVLEAADTGGIIATKLHSTGAHRDLLYIPNALPKNAFTPEADAAHLVMQGNKVFKSAVTLLGEVVDEILADAGLQRSDIDWLVPHQANERIITATAKKLGLPMERVVLTLPQHGNTSAASIPLALAVAVERGQIKKGELLLLEAFGAGFVWGAALIQY
jgi:3-oxoacyl-[acyl-carrier-protein] synthase III